VSEEAATAPQTIATLIQPRGTVLAAAEVLFRQVHPDLFDGDQPASSAFLPSPGDQDQLSTDRSSMTTPKGAYELYVGNKRKSIGTFGVTVGEFDEQGLGCFPDPVELTGTTKANPAHARVDFSVLGTNQQKKAAKRLKKAAVSRGILHKP
jgi:hypothetical protein